MAPKKKQRTGYKAASAIASGEDTFQNVVSVEDVNASKKLLATVVDALHGLRHATAETKHAEALAGRLVPDGEGSTLFLFWRAAASSA